MFGKLGIKAAQSGEDAGNGVLGRIRIWGRMEGVHTAGILYDGDWLELPIEEAAILQKSEEFYGDRSPCFIHRSAVRIRLLAEMEEGIRQQDWRCLMKYTGWSGVTFVEAGEQIPVESKWK